MTLLHNYPQQQSGGGEQQQHFGFEFGPRNLQMCPARFAVHFGGVHASGLRLLIVQLPASDEVVEILRRPPKFAACDRAFGPLGGGVSHEDLVAQLRTRIAAVVPVGATTGLVPSPAVQVDIDALWEQWHTLAGVELEVMGSPTSILPQRTETAKRPLRSIFCGPKAFRPLASIGLRWGITAAKAVLTFQAVSAVSCPQGRSAKEGQRLHGARHGASDPVRATACGPPGQRGWACPV
jgi:hypothetical protein